MENAKENPRITLGPIREEDREQLLDILTSSAVARTYMLPDYASREDAIPLFTRLSGLSREENRFVRGIFLGNTCVGFLNDVEIENGAIELGYAIHPDFWGMGCATGGLKLAIADLFRKGFREVTCGAFEGNGASLRVMEKAGMAPLEKVDEIEYRGKTHRCLYRSITHG